MDQVQKANVTLREQLDKAMAALNAEQHERQKLRQLLHSRQVEECQHEVDLYELRQHVCQLEATINSASDAVRLALRVRYLVKLV
jgi:hypothetical protein